MTPEMKLAQSLGTLPSSETEKLAGMFAKLPADELEAILEAETLREAEEFEKHAAALAEIPIEEIEATLAAPDDPLLRLGDTWGRRLARADFEKTAVPAAVLKGVGGAMRWATGTPMATRALQAGAVGAAGGAVRHATSNDPNSSLVGNMVGGAALGAGAGAGAGAAAKAVGAMRNTVGATARVGLKGSIARSGGTAASSGNQAATQALGGMRAPGRQAALARRTGQDAKGLEQAKAWQAQRTTNYAQRQAQVTAAGAAPGGALAGQPGGPIQVANRPAVSTPLSGTTTAAPVPVGGPQEIASATTSRPKRIPNPAKATWAGGAGI